MTKNNFLKKFLSWLQTTEMFARPVKLLPGKWTLEEYYTENKGVLENFKSNDLKQQNREMIFHFFPDQSFQIQTTLINPGFNGLFEGIWEIQKNYISLIDQSTKQYSEFQFAIVKGKLKLLKKDRAGAIVFFGFFAKSSD